MGIKRQHLQTKSPMIINKPGPEEAKSQSQTIIEIPQCSDSIISK
jgi:hypothetical protein